MKALKKALAAIVLSLAIAMPLAGCGEQSAKPYNPEKLAPNTISPAVLTAREKLLLGNSPGTSFVFDFSADESYGELAIWLERYDFGVLAEERALNMSGTLRTDEDGAEPVRGSIVFSMSPVVDGDGKSGMSGVRVAVANGHGNSAINIPPIETPTGMASVSGSDLQQESPIDGVNTLAQISYSSAEDASMSFATDPEMNEEFIKEFDLTYILKCEFIKKA